jgi:hypothetical protein
MKHIQGYTGCRWKLSLGKCLRHIALTAAKVIDFKSNIKTLPKHK